MLLITEFCLSSAIVKLYDVYDDGDDDTSEELTSFELIDRCRLAVCD